MVIYHNIILHISYYLGENPVCNSDTLEAFKDIMWHNLSWINQRTMCLPGDCSIFNK